MTEENSSEAVILVLKIEMSETISLPLKLNAHSQSLEKC